MTKLDAEGDFTSLSVDGCMKTILKIPSVQPRHRRSRDDFTGEEDVRSADTLITVKSASSAFIGSFVVGRCSAEAMTTKARLISLHT